MRISSTTRRVLAVAAWGLYWLLLVTLTHLPGRPGPEPQSPGIPHLDKVGHAAAFAVLAMITCAAISQFWPLSVRTLLIVGAGLVLYAGIDEYTQGWIPHRIPDRLDWIADATGIASGILLFVLLRQALRRAKSDAAVIAESRPS